MNKKISNNKYDYGFRDEHINTFVMEKGLNPNIINKISLIKNEPEWMLENRQKALDYFFKFPNPSWGPDLNKEVNVDNYTFFIKPTDKTANSWNDVPSEIKETFQKLGIPEAEQKYLAGVSTQYESEVVYHSLMKEFVDLGVVFEDIDVALKKYPELFKEYFGKVIPANDNKYAALNTAVWSGGTFIYVPKGVQLTKPLQSYFRINSTEMGQFERTLIIADEGSAVHYIEGCTAPIYDKNSLHAAAVEIFVKKGARVRYTTIQNWSTNIINLVTKRAIVEEDGLMEWIDGNIGSKINMKYPCCILNGKGARGLTISIAVAKEHVIQDSGAKMIHLAENTNSTIIAKSIAYSGGQADYRGKVFIGPKAKNSFASVKCDTLLLDKESRSQTIPLNKVMNSSSEINHEAKVTELEEAKIFYLMSRGLTREEATHILVIGFLDTFSKELPMEYAVELNQLLKLDMENEIKKNN